jgi:hypothetical protein
LIQLNANPILYREIEIENDQLFLRTGGYDGHYQLGRVQPEAGP